MKSNNEEKVLLKALNNGTLKKHKSAKAEMKIAKKAANLFVKKDARINIRLSPTDLTLLKRKASEEGLPYQTLIASILHKFITGRLLNVV